MLPHKEHGILYPKLCKSELSMRYQIQRPLVDFSGLLRLPSDFFFKDGKIEPQVDIALPEPLL